MAKRKNTASAFKWSDQLVLFRYFLNLCGKDSLADLAGKMNSSNTKALTKTRIHTSGVNWIYC